MQDLIQSDLLTTRRYAPSPSTPQRSGSSCRRTSPQVTERSPSTAACSAPPPPSPGRKGQSRSGRASSRDSTGSASTEDFALDFTSLYVCYASLPLLCSALHPQTIPINSALPGDVQVKSFYDGQDHVGDVPLYKKIAAGFTTGRGSSLLSFFHSFIITTATSPVHNFSLSDDSNASLIITARCHRHRHCQPHRPCQGQAPGRGQACAWCATLLCWRHGRLCKDC